jgi:hypothetical protein
MLGLFFDFQEGGDMHLRNVCWFSTEFTALYPRRQSSFTCRYISEQSDFKPLSPGDTRFIVALNPPDYWNSRYICSKTASLSVHRTLQFTFAIRHLKIVWGNGLYEKFTIGTIKSQSENLSSSFLFFVQTSKKTISRLCSSLFKEQIELTLTCYKYSVWREISFNCLWWTFLDEARRLLPFYYNSVRK